MKTKYIRKKRIAAVSALLLAAFLLGGCGFIEITRPGVDSTTADPSTSGEPIAGTDAPGVSAETTAAPTAVSYPDRKKDAEEALAALPTLSLSADKLIIANSAATAMLIYPDEADVLNAARGERTKMASDRYDIEISVTAPSDDALYSDLLLAARAGTYYADLTVIPAISAAKFYSAGLSGALGQLPFYTIDTSSAGVGGGACYVYTGKATNDADSIWVLYFNRTLAGTELTRELYSAALSTEGLSLERVLSAASELTSTESATETVAIVGGDSDNYSYLADVICAACGVRFTDNTFGQDPTVLCDETALTAADELLGRIASLLYIPSGDGARAPGEIFAEGGALFRFGPLSDIRTLYSERTEWGILPVPCTATNASYTLVGSQTQPVMIFTGGESRTEVSGAALAALDSASGAWLYDAYAEAAFDTCLRDNDSYIVLRRLLNEEKSLDFAYLYAEATEKLADATYGAARDRLLSGKSLVDALKSAKSAADRELAKMF